MKAYKTEGQKRELKQKTSLVEVTKAEMMLLNTIRAMENPDELVRIGSEIDTKDFKYCLLNLAAEKISNVEECVELK